MYTTPDIFKKIPGLVAAESTRMGGVSSAPYDALNLGKSTGDAPENVLENRRRFCETLGFEPSQMAFSHQVHGDQVCLVDAPGGHSGFDALVTRQTGVLLAVSVADCVPLLFFDARLRVLAAVHAGWKGTVAQIARKTLDQMAATHGTQASDCLAYIGTCIDACSFEVGEEVAEAFDTRFVSWDAIKGKHFVDLKTANRAQCLDFGIPAGQIEVSPRSTVLNNDLYFSHRKNQGVTGRMLAVIGLLG